MKKVSIKLFVLCLTATLFCVGTFAQEAELKADSEEKKNFISGKNAIGAVIYTPTIGFECIVPDFVYGICYQRWIIPQFALEFGGIVTSPGFSEVLYNVYVEAEWAFFQHVASENFATRFFLWGLLGHIGRLVNIHSLENYNLILGQKYEFCIRGSVGLGFEMIIAQHISIPLKFGFSVSEIMGFTFGTSIKYLW